MNSSHKHHTAQHGSPTAPRQTRGTTTVSPGQFRNNGGWESTTDSLKSTTEPGICQAPHPPQSHSAPQHWEIPHSFPSHALFLFPSPSSLEKTASSWGRDHHFLYRALYSSYHNDKVYSRNNKNTEFYQLKTRVRELNKFLEIYDQLVSIKVTLM